MHTAATTESSHCLLHSSWFLYLCWFERDVLVVLIVMLRGGVETLI